MGEILLQKGGYDLGILPSLRSNAAQDGEKAAVHLITDVMVDAFYLVGSADHCNARIKAYQEAGVDQALLLPRLHDYRAVAEALKP